MSHAFGSFNPNFYGISQSLGNEDWISALWDYGEEDDLAVWRADQQDFDIDRLGSLSTPDHEVRHFHDSLLCPWSIQNMIYRLQASMNGVAALRAMTLMEGNQVPTPICRWMQWRQGERKDWFETSGLTSFSDLIPLPTLDLSRKMPPEAQPSMINEMTQLLSRPVEATARSYLSIQASRSSYEFGSSLRVSPFDIFEATAHITQAMSINIGQGKDSLEKHMEHIFHSKKSVLQPLKLFWAIHATNTEEVNLNHLLATFTWMLIGNGGAGPLGEGEGNPANRFRTVALFAMSAPRDFLTLWRPGSTARYWDNLDELTEHNPWRDNLRASLVRIRSRVDLLNSDPAQPAEENDFRGSIGRVARMWECDVESVINLIINDPDDYCDGERYLLHTVLNFPLPFLLVHYGLGTYSHENPSQLSSNTRSVFIGEDRTNLLYTIINLRNASNADFNAIANTYAIQKILDYIFYEESAELLVDEYYKKGGQAITQKTFIHAF